MGGLVLGQVEEDVHGEGDDLHVRHGAVAPLDEVEQDLEAAVALRNELVAAVRRETSGSV